MSEQKIKTCLTIDHSENTRTIKILEPTYSLPCMLCENTREVPSSRQYCLPWVCDECKEAIAFIKELKHKQESFDPLKPILD
jgi:hypothetical protein